MALLSCLAGAAPSGMGAATLELEAARDRIESRSPVVDLNLPMAPSSASALPVEVAFVVNTLACHLMLASKAPITCMLPALQASITMPSRKSSENGWFIHACLLQTGVQMLLAIVLLILAMSSIGIANLFFQSSLPPELPR